MADDMAILCCIGIAIDEGNDPVTENAPAQQQSKQGQEQQGGEVWKS